MRNRSSTGRALDARTLRSDLIATFVLTSRLQPEARGGGIEEAKQAQVFGFRSTCRQLNDRSRTFEHLAAAIEDEVVVRSDVAECDGQRSAVCPLGRDTGQYCSNRAPNLRDRFGCQNPGA